MYSENAKTGILNHIHIEQHASELLADDINTNLIGENSLESDSHLQVLKYDLARQIVVFHIKGMDITLPQQPTIVVGRVTSPKNQSQPDVDLSIFESGDKSISRRHVAVQRRDSHIYLMDLYSSNGTWLNGLRLLPNNPQCIQHGDEIRLGRVVVQVKYCI